MLTVKQNLRETIHGGNPDRYVDQYEYLAMVPDPVIMQSPRPKNDGVPVVLSNASHNYFDMAYNNSKLERGHSWSGYVSEKTSFSFLPYSINCKTKLSAQGKRYLLGVQGQLWTETIRNFDHVTYYIFPKAAGLFERGWNAAPEWSGTEDEAFETDFDKFFSIIVQNEYPYYDSIGITYHKN